MPKGKKNAARVDVFFLEGREHVGTEFSAVGTLEIGECQNHRWRVDAPDRGRTFKCHRLHRNTELGAAGGSFLAGYERSVH